MDYKDILERLRRIRDGCDDGEAVDEAMDIIFDYEKAVAQAVELLLKYETARDAIRRGTGSMATWQCPTCQKFIGYGNEHCHWCGQKLGWEIKPKKKRKR